MNANILIDALEGVGSDYIISAYDCLAPSRTLSERKQAARRRVLRRTLIGIAAALALLIASFTAAMALSDDFRSAVFSILRLSGVETVPEDDGALPESGAIEHFDGSSIDGAVTVRYFKVNGVTNIIDGLVYSAPYGEDDGVFYDLDADGLHELETTLVEFPYSFRGTDFDISFSYAVCGGQAHFRANPKQMNEDPYKYGWDIRAVGSEDNALLLLPYETPLGYGLYPLLLDISTGELGDLLGAPVPDGVTPFNWQFTDDMRYALMSGYAAGYEVQYWLYDSEAKRMTNMSELTGRELFGLSGCYPIGGSFLACCCLAENGVDVLRFDCDSKTSTVILEGAGLRNIGGGVGELVNIQYYGAPGRHALLVGDGGNVTLVDLTSGILTPLDGVTYGDSLLTYESPDGGRILFARRETGVVNSSAMYELGILNTETGVLTALQRENYLVRGENPCGWLRDGSVCVYASDGSSAGYCLYVYGFPASSIQTAGGK